MSAVHYTNDSANNEWLKACRDMWSEGERAPVQTYNGERLVNVAGIALVPESRVAELLGEVAA